MQVVRACDGPPPLCLPSLRTLPCPGAPSPLLLLPPGSALHPVAPLPADHPPGSAAAAAGELEPAVPGVCVCRCCLPLSSNPPVTKHGQLRWLIASKHCQPYWPSCPPIPYMSPPSLTPAAAGAALPHPPRDDQLRHRRLHPERHHCGGGPHIAAATGRAGGREGGRRELLAEEAA